MLKVFVTTLNIVAMLKVHYILTYTNKIFLAFYRSLLTSLLLHGGVNDEGHLFT